MIISLPQDVKDILSTLNDNGYKAYVVGGCVRDSLLYKTPKDWDICTNAKPEQVMEVFKEYNIVPTGLKHGTITVFINDIGYEITTFRKESDYDEHRRPKEVEFIDDLEEDLSRRDFTINAMAYHPEEGIIDPFHGRDDLILKTIRVVWRDGDSASSRFMEDPLRALRAYRFAAKYGFVIDNWTLRYGIESLTLFEFESLSMERIRDEFNKILMYDPLQLHYMNHTMLHTILPGFMIRQTQQNNPYHIYDTYIHSIKATLECYECLELRLAALLHDIGKDRCKTTDENGIDHFYRHAEESAKIAESYLKRLKYDNKTIDTVITLIKYHDCEINTKKAIKKMLNRLGKKNFLLLLDLKTADIKAQNPEYMLDRLRQLSIIEEILDEICFKNQECYQLKDLALHGKDLITLGVEPGPEIGRLLNIMLDAVMENPELNNKKSLIKIFKENRQ